MVKAAFPGSLIRKHANTLLHHSKAEVAGIRFLSFGEGDPMTISTTIGRAVSLAMAVFAITTPVVAEPAGLAVYASYQDSSYAADEAQKLQALLQSPVEKNQVVIDGQTYTRLQSPALSAQSARTLVEQAKGAGYSCLLYTSPSPRDRQKSRMPSSA